MDYFFDASSAAIGVAPMSMGIIGSGNFRVVTCNRRVKQLRKYTVTVHRSFVITHKFMFMTVIALLQQVTLLYIYFSKANDNDNLKWKIRNCGT